MQEVVAWTARMSSGSWLPAQASLWPRPSWALVPSPRVTLWPCRCGSAEAHECCLCLLPYALSIPFFIKSNV